MMRKMMQHYFNALHVYCRLIDLGISAKLARKIAALYESLLTCHLLYH